MASHRQRFVFIACTTIVLACLTFSTVWLRRAAFERGAQSVVAVQSQPPVALITATVFPVASPGNTQVASTSPTQAPSWAVPFGREFWRQNARPDPGATNPDFRPPSPATIRDAIDRVSHGFAWHSQTECRAELPGCVAALSGGQLRFTPSTRADLGAIPESEVSFRTRSIQLGGRERVVDEALGLENGWVKGNTAQVLLDPESGLIQHYEARGAGVEVSWVLRKPVRGSHDMAIEVELTGVQFQGESPSGLRFGNSDLTSRVTVGPAVVVDSAGQRWAVPVEVASGLLRMTIPADVLARAEYPLAVDPLISPEFGTDTPVDGPTPSTLASPAVAASDSGYFVVWTHGAGDTTSPGVYAARVDPSGKLLDPYGILVSSIAAEQTVCAVAAISESFLVVWSGPRGASKTEWDIFGARITADGTVLDTPALSLCAASGVQCSPSVAANGTNYLAVWRDSRQTGIYGNLITPQGNISATNGFPICVAVNDQFTPSVASLGGDFLVVWQDYRSATTTRYYSDIYGARVAGSGALIDPIGIPICTQTNSQYHPAVAAGGANYLVVWEDYDSEGNDILGARVTTAGVVLDPIPVAISHAPNLQAYPSIASTSDGCFVAWQDHRDSPTNNFEAEIRGTRVGVDGVAEDSAGLALSAAAGSRWYPSVAARGAEVLAVWQDGRANPDTTLADIYGARVSAGTTPVVQPETLVSPAVNAELSPSVAANGTNYLVAWTDNRHALTNGLDIYAARLNQDGSLLDAVPITICTQTNKQSDPAVAANGTDYFVVWSDWRNTPANATHADIYGSLVRLDGQVLQTNGFAVCVATNDQSVPVVAAQGSNFFVAWQDARNSVGTTIRLDIHGTRVSGAGEVLDTNGIPLCTATGNQTTPAIAANTYETLVVWTDFRASATQSDIYGTRVGPDGTVLDTNGIPICTAAAQQSSPAVATDGLGFFVAWADSRNGTASGSDIYGAMVGVDGLASPTNGFPIRLAAGNQTAPAVAFNGSTYLVAWQESEAGFTDVFDIYGSGISVDGTPWAGAPIAINTSAHNQLAPAAVPGSNGRFLVVHQGFQDSAPRVAANIVNLESLPLLAAPRLANGQIELELRGAVGDNYAIEASTDLQSWTQLGSLTLTNSMVRITQTPAPNITSRFYRAVLFP